MEIAPLFTKIAADPNNPQILDGQIGDISHYSSSKTPSDYFAETKDQHLPVINGHPKSILKKSTFDLDSATSASCNQEPIKGPTKIRGGSWRPFSGGKIADLNKMNKPHDQISVPHADTASQRRVASRSTYLRKTPSADQVVNENSTSPHPQLMALIEHQNKLIEGLQKRLDEISLKSESKLILTSNACQTDVSCFDQPEVGTNTDIQGVDKHLDVNCKRSRITVADRFRTTASDDHVRENQLPVHIESSNRHRNVLDNRTDPKASKGGRAFNRLENNQRNKVSSSPIDHQSVSHTPLSMYVNKMADEFLPPDRLAHYEHVRSLPSNQIVPFKSTNARAMTPPPNSRMCHEEQQITPRGMRHYKVRTYEELLVTDPSDYFPACEGQPYRQNNGQGFQGAQRQFYHDDDRHHRNDRQFDGFKENYNPRPSGVQRPRYPHRNEEHRQRYYEQEPDTRVFESIVDDHSNGHNLNHRNYRVNRPNTDSDRSFESLPEDTEQFQYERNRNEHRQQRPELGHDKQRTRRSYPVR